MMYTKHMNKKHSEVPWNEHKKCYTCTICKFTAKYLEQIDIHHESKHGIQDFILKQFTVFVQILKIQYIFCKRSEIFINLSETHLVEKL